MGAWCNYSTSAEIVQLEYLHDYYRVTEQLLSRNYTATSTTTVHVLDHRSYKYWHMHSICTFFHAGCSPEISVIWQIYNKTSPSLNHLQTQQLEDENTLPLLWCLNFHIAGKIIFHFQSKHQQQVCQTMQSFLKLAVTQILILLICDPAPLNEALWGDYQNQEW